MINTSELRLGNWIKPHGKDGEAAQVTCVQMDRAYHINGWDFDVNIHGIELSPSILEKCGFVKRNDSGGSFWIKDISKLSGIFIYEKDNKTGIVIDAPEYRDYPCNDANEDHITNCQYLHQLQNLYYALTQNELEIKL